MAGLSDISITVADGGLGVRPPNEDKVSGLLFYNDTLPSGFGASDRVKLVKTLAEAEALGIVEGSATSGVMWYHISEYFRLNPQGELYIGIYATETPPYAFADITAMANAANGRIRQLGVYVANDIAFATAEVTAIQSVVDDLRTDRQPLIVLYAADLTGVASGWAGADDLRALAAKSVCVVAGEDAGAAGAALATSEGYSITFLGAALGAVSFVAVNESIGWVAKVNASNGVELETIGLANGDANSDLTSTQLASVKDKGYLIGVKRLPEVTGTYFERAPMAIPATSDFAFMENNRVIDKGIRLAAAALVPQLMSPLSLQADGTMRDDTVKYFQGLVENGIEPMAAADEISNFAVLIDPAQDVLSNSTVEVTLQIQPTATAEFITVTIGLTASV